ncbi:MAG: TIGR00282 family metallophosphoesterase [Deltaproteobacteria bacterium]|nr:TIGR00282 family metallophosphoesterase [Deltaproteobacteria bacterium]
MKILFLGDVVGRPGRQAVRRYLAEVLSEQNFDLVIANGENASGGLGLEPTSATELYASGVNVITSGNHIWNKKDIIDFLEQNKPRLIRPYNYPVGAPGAGVLKYKLPSRLNVCVINLIGRVFLETIADCPFRAIDKLLNEELANESLIFVDFHAEATSEKMAMGWYLDGRVSALVGTHTHVQTADERIFPKGTAYITDVGMCGPRNSVIGAEAGVVVERFLSGRPLRYEVARGEMQINGIIMSLDEESGKALSIERINSNLPL